MIQGLNAIHFREPRFLLMYPALQFAPDEMAKPDGSLSLPYVAGALRRANYDVQILDVCVGDAQDRLEDTFYKTTFMPSGLIRCGLSKERVARKIADFDVIGVSSIFTTQTSMVLELTRLVKEIDPRKLVIAGGVNARNLRNRFFDNGVDVIVLTEAENTIVEIAEAVRRKKDLTSVRGIAFRNPQGKEIINPAGPVVTDLDELPFPAWDLLPLEKYWDISRPHGGDFPPGMRIKYASLQTSRGCPFRCMYCHISKEVEDSAFGDLGSLRVKSIDRVLQELQILKDLGVEYVFFEDDSLLAKKKRAYEMFRAVSALGLHLSDVNGINICHLQKNFGGDLAIDKEFLEVIAEAGFHALQLPFESASPRLLSKYSTSKWSIEKTNTKELINACGDVGISTAGNYMLGYPDETLPEMHSTILMAKQHVEQGLQYANLFAVVPFPGTSLYDMVIQNGQLDVNFNTDQMKWTKSLLKNIAVPAETLEQIRQLAWLTVNRSEYVDYKIAMRVKTPAVPLPRRAAAVAGTQLAIL